MSVEDLTIHSSVPTLKDDNVVKSAMLQIAEERAQEFSDESSFFQAKLFQLLGLSSIKFD
jgi:hypothetical protein